MRARHAVRGLILGVLTVAVLPLAAGGTDAPAAFVAAVEEAKGHLLVSVETRRLGQPIRAGVHAAHPLQELGRRLWGPVETVDAALATRMKQVVKRPGDAIERKATPAEYARVVAETVAALDEIVDRVVPAETRAHPAFAADVIRRLLALVSEEYEESWADDRIVVEIEYQDAWGFLTRARAVWQAARPRLRGDATALASEIDRQFEVLGRALPGVRTPVRPMAPTRVDAAIQSITTSLATLVARAPIR